MNDLAKANEDRFVAPMPGRLGERAAEVIGAVNNARAGHRIDDSEGLVLEELRKSGQNLYQAAMHARGNATEAVASFPPSGRLGAGDGGTQPAQPLGLQFRLSQYISGLCGTESHPILEASC